MKSFIWEGRNNRGEQLRGSIDADSSDAVAAQLMAGGVIPINIEVSTQKRLHDRRKIKARFFIYLNLPKPFLRNFNRVFRSPNFCVWRI